MFHSGSQWVDEIHSFHECCSKILMIISVLLFYCMFILTDENCDLHFLMLTIQDFKMMASYVGFANLPNQVHRKSVKKGFEFTLMVVGKAFHKNHCYLVIV